MTPRRRNVITAPGPVPLLMAILADRPNLTAAACRGRHPLFDAARHPEPGTDSTTARAAARRLCTGCPERTNCPDRLDTDSSVPGTSTPESAPAVIKTRTRHQ